MICDKLLQLATFLEEIMIMILVKVENVLYFLHLKPHTIEAVRNDDKKGRVMAVGDGLCKFAPSKYC